MIETLEDLEKVLEEDLKEESLPADVGDIDDIESLLPPAELPSEGFESLEDLIEEELSQD